jgi:hypothetical protein
VFAQTEAKSLIQLYPEQQARMKEFAALSLSLFLSLYQYRQATAELLCEDCKTIFHLIAARTCP